MSLTVQRINSKFCKSCFIWQVCQSRYMFSCLPLYSFQGVNILCQVWAPKLDTILKVWSYICLINSSLEILTNVLLSIPKIFVAQAAALSQCKENFKDVVQIPRSFSTSTSFRFSTGSCCLHSVVATQGFTNVHKFTFLKIEIKKINSWPFLHFVQISLQLNYISNTSMSLPTFRESKTNILYDLFLKGNGTIQQKRSSKERDL